MIEQQLPVMLLYLIKTILILRELIQHSSLGSKILRGASPLGAGCSLLLLLGVCPTPGPPGWAVQVGPGCVLCPSW